MTATKVSETLSDGSHAWNVVVDDREDDNTILFHCLTEGTADLLVRNLHTLTVDFDAR